MYSRLLSLACFLQPQISSYRSFFGGLVMALAALTIPAIAQEQDKQQLSESLRQVCKVRAMMQTTGHEAQKQFAEECQREAQPKTSAKGQSEKQQLCQMKAVIQTANIEEQKRLIQECQREASNLARNTPSTRSPQVAPNPAPNKTSDPELTADPTLDTPPAPPVSVATSPIPASLLPPASPKLDVTVAPSSAPNTDASAGPGKDDIVEVVVQGMGIDANSALLNAYSNAVQQALGLYVDAETLVQNDEIVRDKILTYSKGFIQEATTVKQSQANGLFQVNIRAKVKRQKLLEQAKANNITVKAVEGVSLHAQVVTQVKQEQDAKTLLDNALLPFLGTQLYRAELNGEPKILKQDGNSVILSYPVSLYVDEIEYKKAANNIINVLDKISIKKEEKLLVTEESGRDNNALSSREGSIIAVMFWKDKSLSRSKWYIYFLPKISLSKSKNYNPLNLNENSYQQSEMVIELSLVGENNDLIAVGAGVDVFYGGKYHGDVEPFYRQEDSYRFRNYFVDEKNMLKANFDIQVPIDQQDLVKVKHAKLEIKKGD